ncbi:MAG: metallophosphoesterase family protein [Thermosynechococcaceae cyanobacterium]
MESSRGIAAPSHRRVMIGDVHGHYQTLLALWELLSIQENDQVYFLGDLIDRGPDSAQVIQFVKESGHTCLLGNHEHLMLMAFPNGELDCIALQTWIHCGGQPTLDNYDNFEDLKIDALWLATLPTYLDLGDIWLVHAGVNPKLPLAKQTKEELCWIRQAFHQAAKPYFPDKLIITGHTITFTLGVSPGQIAQGPGWLDIETGAYHSSSGWLTALDYDREQVYQVNVFSQESRIRPLTESISVMKT